MHSPHALVMTAIAELLQREEEKRNRPPVIEISDQLLPKWNRKERRAQKARQRRLKR